MSTPSVERRRWFPTTRQTLLRLLSWGRMQSQRKDRERAWEEFQRNYQRPVVALCRHLGLGESEAEEVYQELCVCLGTKMDAILKRQPEVESEQPGQERKRWFGPYLHAIVRHRVVDRWRSHNSDKARRQGYEQARDASGTSLRTQEVDARIDLLYVHELVSHLIEQGADDANDLMAWRLFRELLVPAKEIASRLRVSLPEVYRKVHRVDEKVRKVLGGA